MDGGIWPETLLRPALFHFGMQAKISRLLDMQNPLLEKVHPAIQGVDLNRESVLRLHFF